MNASFTVIIGEDELARGKLGVRDMDNGDQREVPMLEIVDYLTRLLQTRKASSGPCEGQTPDIREE